LGQTATVAAPVRCVWVATANNPTLSTEIARRTIRIRIDPKMDRPQLREGFRHPDLRSWGAAHRGALVAAALTLIRAWVVAGRPSGTQRLGSYEEWAQVMGGILDVAGVPGFLDNLMEVYDLADNEGTQWRAFVAAWWEQHGEAPVSAATLFELAKTVDGFDLGKSTTERGMRTAFGMALGRQRDRLYDKWRIVKVGERQRLALWGLAAQDAADQASVPVYPGVPFQPPAYRNSESDPICVRATGVKGTPGYTGTPDQSGVDITDDFVEPPCPGCGVPGGCICDVPTREPMNWERVVA